MGKVYPMRPDQRCRHIDDPMSPTQAPL